MGLEVTFAHPDMERTGKIVGFDVALVRTHRNRLRYAFKGDIAVARVYGHSAVFGNFDGEIEASVPGVCAAQGNRVALDGQFGLERIETFSGGMIVRGIHLQMRLNMDL